MSSQTMEPEQTTSEDPPAARSGWSAQSSTLGLVAVAGVFAALVFLLVKDSLTDDAYITLAYAKNLATDGHWGLIPQQISNSATSPLNVLLLGALAWVTTWFGEVSPVFGLGVLTVLVTMAQAWGWARLVRALRLTGWVGIATAAVGLLLVLANPFVLSAVGLEVLLVPAVLVLMVAFVLESRPVAFGVVAGLALLIRLDLVIFVVLLALCTQAIRRKLHIAALSAVLVSAPWYLFSWFYLGSAVPDTLVIKQSQGGLFGIWTYLTGPIMYFIGKMRDVGFAFLPMVFGVLALLAWLLVRFGVRWTNRPPALGPVLALGLGGLAYYGVYTVMGVGPYHWYYVPPMVALSSALAVLAGWWLARAREQERLRIAAPLGALGLVALLGLGNLANDMRHGVPWESPVIFGNWASAQDYARVGEELGQRLAGATVASPGEIGTLAYFCECSIVDVFSDRGQAIDRVDERIDESNAIGKAVWRFNYLWLDRSVQPRPVDYELVYEEGPGSGPDTWEVNSANKGVGHFRLEPAQPR